MHLNHINTKSKYVGMQFLLWAQRSEKKTSTNLLIHSYYLFVKIIIILYFPDLCGYSGLKWKLKKMNMLLKIKMVNKTVDKDNTYVVKNKKNKMVPILMSSTWIEGFPKNLSTWQLSTGCLNNKSKISRSHISGLCAWKCSKWNFLSS